MAAVVAAIFGAVFLTVLAVCLGIDEKRRSPAAELKQRLRRLEKGDEPSEALVRNLLRETSSAERFVFGLPLLGKLKTLIVHSGLAIAPLRFVAAAATIAVSVFVVVALLGNPTAAFFTAMLTILTPVGYLQYRTQQRQRRFDELLPDALVMTARSLRAGHSMSGAVELISQEVPEPVGGLFRIAFERQKLGMRMTDALSALTERIDSIDLLFFVTIVRINSETGGNLAEILEKLADTIRTRLQIRRQVQVFTAEGRLSGYVLVVLPVVVFIAFYLKNPEYMQVFFTERICQFSLGAAALAQLAGFMMIRRIVNIRI